MSNKQYSNEEQKIIDEAVKWAKSNKKVIARQLTDKSKYPSDAHPVAYFMAGCPAAGKTEFAKAFAEAIASYSDSSEPIIYIDPDEIREQIPGYNGRNSRLFQYPASIIVDKTFDMIMSNRQSFILDGTLSDSDIASRNAKRCLDKEYKVQVLFVYNDPIMSWKAAAAREVSEGRAVPMDIFIDRYFKSKESVRYLKQEFGQNIQIDLLFKELNKQAVRPEFNIDNIDNYIPEKYNRQSLEKALLKSEEV